MSEPVPCARCHKEPRAHASSYCKACRSDIARAQRGGQPSDRQFRWRKVKA